MSDLKSQCRTHFDFKGSHYVKLLAHPQLVCSVHTVLIPYAISFVHGSFLASLMSIWITRSVTFYSVYDKRANQQMLGPTTKH